MNDQLQDLLIPPEQADFNGLLWLDLALLLGLLVLALWRWNRNRRKPAVIALKALQKLPGHTDEPSKVALQVSRLLCQGLDVTRLEQFQANDVPAWERFCQQLNKACYSPSGMFDGNMQALLNDAKRWLSRERDKR